MNKSGYLKIIEASIAIIIIIGFLFAFYTKRIENVSPDFSQEARYVLEEVSNNYTLREEVLNEEKTQTSSFVAGKVPSYLAFEVKICEIDDVCGKSNFTEGEVYAAERVISTNVKSQDFKPLKLKLFLWRK